MTGIAKRCTIWRIQITDWSLLNATFGSGKKATLAKYFAIFWLLYFITAIYLMKNWAILFYQYNCLGKNSQTIALMKQNSPKFASVMN